MFFEFVTNFSILFTFTVLIFWPFIHYSNKPFIMKYKSYIAGVTFGIVAIILTLLTREYANGVLINSRTIFLLFGGLLGGPITILITGFIIVISRPIFLFTSTLSVIMMINFLFVTCGTAYAAYKRPITYQNIVIYFFVLTFEHAFVLAIYYRCSIKGMQYLAIFLIFSVISFYAIRKILSQLEDTHTQVKQIYTLGKTDFLTQLPNNAAIEQKLSLLIQSKVPFELLYINLQQFKKINLQYQYKTGDALLIEVSQLLSKQLTDNEVFIGRASSDEFYVILPNLAPAQSITIAYNICRAVEQHPFHIDKDTSLSLALTIGICSYPTNSTSVEQIYQCAYHALQQAKMQEEVKVFHFNQFKKPS